jgi:hypothetical protein
MNGRARHRAVAAGLVLLGLVALEAMAGCRVPGMAASDTGASNATGGSSASGTGEASPGSSPSAKPNPGAGDSSLSPSTPPPAALAGGACLLLNFDEISKALGVTFNVAAAATSGDTYTCDIQSTTASYPDLSLAITATDLLPLDFTAQVAPSGSKPVTKLGKIGYVLQVKATTSVGPAVEVGWLSGNERLIVMRYTFPTNATASDATALASKMITLAHTVDATTV